MVLKRTVYSTWQRLPLARQNGELRIQRAFIFDKGSVGKSEVEDMELVVVVEEEVAVTTRSLYAHFQVDESSAEQTQGDVDLSVTATDGVLTTTGEH